MSCARSALNGTGLPGGAVLGFWISNIRGPIIRRRITRACAPLCICRVVPIPSTRSRCKIYKSLFPARRIGEKWSPAWPPFANVSLLGCACHRVPQLQG